VEEGAAEEYYEENADQFESRCLAHILVGTNDEEQPTGERTREEAATRAAELRADLEAGADFTELASSDANDDTVSAAQGGSLDCITRETQFDPTFLEAAFAAEVGEVTEPVETQFGFHLILVSSADVPPFEDVRGQIEEQLAGGTGGFDELLRSATCERDVDVASRYGTWDTSPCAEGSFASVQPPEGPVTATTALAPSPDGAAGEDPAGSDSGG
jgi:parvulin-like peptidyl-prolyl isomerase